MNVSREMLGDRLEKYETQLRSLKSFIKELKARVAEHGTDEEHYGEDLFEAEHNVTFYEAEITRIKKELRGWGRGGSGDGVLPQTLKQGLGTLIFATLGFTAGVLIGSRLMPRPSGQRAPEDNSNG